MLNRAEPTPPLHCHILLPVPDRTEGGMGNERKTEKKVLYFCHWWNSPTKGAQQAEHESEGNREEKSRYTEMENDGRNEKARLRW